jgi:cytochrome b
MREKHQLWDIPTRLFHWLIVACVGLSWWSGEQGDFDRHAWSGYTVIVLVVFRIAWGFVGSKHSRFGDFVAGPAQVLAYIRGKFPGSAGHSPLGSWSVLVLLTLLLVQALSGLFNSDDVMFQGPFHYAAPGEFRDFMGVVHEWVFYVLAGFIALHLLAVMYYQLLKKVPLIQAMIRGRAAGREGEQAPVPLWIALIVVLLAAALLWTAVSLAPQPQRMW